SRSLTYGVTKSCSRSHSDSRACRMSILFTLRLLSSNNRLARSSIQEVSAVPAGPPWGGLYLKPPSSGGLWEGVITIPSARRSFVPLLYVRMAWEITGVGVYWPSG